MLLLFAALANLRTCITYASFKHSGIPFLCSQAHALTVLIPSKHPLVAIQLSPPATTSAQSQ